MKSLRRQNTFPMTAIETKMFMELLFFSLALAKIIGVFEWRPKTVSLKTRSGKILNHYLCQLLHINSSGCVYDSLAYKIENLKYIVILGIQ